MPSAKIGAPMSAVTPLTMLTLARPSGRERVVKALATRALVAFFLPKSASRAVMEMLFNPSTAL